MAQTIDKIDYKQYLLHFMDDEWPPEEMEEKMIYWNNTLDLSPFALKTFAIGQVHKEFCQAHPYMSLIAYARENGETSFDTIENYYEDLWDQFFSDSVR